MHMMKKYTTNINPCSVDVHGTEDDDEFEDERSARELNPFSIYFPGEFSPLGVDVWVLLGDCERPV